MRCTVQYSKDSKISPVGFSNRNGFTLIEMICCLLIISCLMMPLVNAVNRISADFSQLIEPLLIINIRNKILHTSSECICRLKEGKIVYNEGQELNGFVFLSNLILEFTYYGQIKLGASAILEKNDKLYRLSVCPVTGTAELYQVDVK